MIYQHEESIRVLCSGELKEALGPLAWRIGIGHEHKMLRAHRENVTSRVETMLPGNQVLRRVIDDCPLDPSIAQTVLEIKVV